MASGGGGQWRVTPAVPRLQILASDWSTAAQCWPLIGPSSAMVTIPDPEQPSLRALTLLVST